MAYEHKTWKFLPAKRRGNENEYIVCQKYISEMSQTHMNYICTVLGLIINTNYPHLGANPDGIINCKCCGEGLLEIKCQFSVKIFILPGKQTR